MACDLAFGAPGDVETNARAILTRVAQAREAGADVLLLPELCLSSGSCGDLFFQPLFLTACREAAQDIARATDGLLVVFGMPLIQETGERRLYNALAVACDGRMLGFVTKTILPRPQRAVFDAGAPEEVRWAGQALPCFRDGVVSLRALGFPGSALIGFGDERWPLHPDEGLDRHAVVLLSFLLPAAAGRMRPAFPMADGWFQGIACLAYANAGAAEGTGDAVYPGDAGVFLSGRLAGEAAPFTLGSALSHPAGAGSNASPDGHRTAYDAPDPRMPYAPAERDARARWCRDCVEIAARGLATRMRRIGSRAAILGVSGGLDSAMALLVTRRAFDLMDMPIGQIHAYTLPGLGSSARTRGNAWRLMEALGSTAREIDLKASILKHFEDIGQDPDTHDTAFENAQARERTQVLMDLANRHQGLMVGSGDLSELALGFTTFGGDHLSMYGVNAGLYKTAIRLVIAQCVQDADNETLRGALLDILDTPVSPELLPGKDDQISQKTEDILGPYVLNDFFLHHFLLSRLEPARMLEAAQEAFNGEFSRGELTERMRAFFNRFFRNQFKRNCLPDGPEVLGVSLSPRGGFALPSDASAAVWLQAAGRLATKG